MGSQARVLQGDLQLETLQSWGGVTESFFKKIKERVNEKRGLAEADVPHSSTVRPIVASS